MEIGKLFNQITTGLSFSQDRYKTREVVHTVLEKIGPNLEKNDFEALHKLNICAPSLSTLSIAVPNDEMPTVWLSPEIENTNDLEAAEHATVKAFAEGIALTRNIARNRLEAETRKMLDTWKYPATTHTAQPARASA